MTTITWEEDIPTVSEANSCEHWGAKHERHIEQQFLIRMSFERHVKNLKLPCCVTIIRLSPRELDDDNLPMSVKSIRDEIAQCIFPETRGIYFTRSGRIKSKKGHGDRDQRVKWQYGQEKRAKQGIRIEVSY